MLLFALVCTVAGLPANAQGASTGQAGLSDAEKAQRASDHLSRMKAALSAVLYRIEEARSEKDVVKLNCVNEKLTQIKGLLKVAEQADIALHESIANRDDGADAELSKIGITRTKVETLRGDADRCLGQLAYIVDEKTTVEVQQPANLPEHGVTDRDVTRPAFVAPPVVRPPAASRYY
jgi:hypothetical protein